MLFYCLPARKIVRTTVVGILVISLCIVMLLCLSGCSKNRQNKRINCTGHYYMQEFLFWNVHYSPTEYKEMFYLGNSHGINKYIVLHADGTGYLVRENRYDQYQEEKCEFTYTFNSDDGTGYIMLPNDFSDVFNPDETHYKTFFAVQDDILTLGSSDNGMQWVFEK